MCVGGGVVMGFRLVGGCELVRVLCVHVLRIVCVCVWRVCVNLQLHSGSGNVLFFAARVLVCVVLCAHCGGQREGLSVCWVVVVRGGRVHNCLVEKNNAFLPGDTTTGQ